MKQVRSNTAEETQNFNSTPEPRQNENGIAFILAFFVVSALLFLVFSRSAM